MTQSRFVYCAYPIDFAGEKMRSIYPSVARAKTALHDLGVAVCYDPGDAFSVMAGAQPGREIDWVNRRALHEADSIIAFLPKDVPSVGVPVEIERAWREGKNVAVVTDGESWILNGYPNANGRMFVADAAGLGWSDAGVAAATWLAARDAGGGLPQTQDPLPVLVGQDGTLPRRSHAEDAGLDLFVSADCWVTPGEARDVPCDIRMELPPGTWGLIMGRSSTRRSRGLLVHPGVIDEGYRGDIFVMVENTTADRKVEVSRGERLGQLILMNNATRWVEPEPVARLNASTRGEGGFGSTGV